MAMKLKWDRNDWADLGDDNRFFLVSMDRGNWNVGLKHPGIPSSWGSDFEMVIYGCRSKAAAKAETQEWWDAKEPQTRAAAELAATETAMRNAQTASYAMDRARKSARRVPAGVFTVPKSWGWPEHVQVMVGSCVKSGKPITSHYAHAHTLKDGYHNWICTKSNHVYDNPRRLSGPPFVTMLHELAHVVTDDGHSYKWADKMLALGVKPEQDWKLAKIIRVRAAAQKRKLQAA